MEGWVFSKSRFGEGFGDLVGFGGDFAFGEVGDELLEFLAGFGLAVELIEAAAVVEEDDIEEIRVGMVGDDVFEDIDGAGLVLFLVVEGGHFRDGVADTAGVRELLIDLLVGDEGVFEMALRLAARRLERHRLVAAADLELREGDRVVFLGDTFLEREGDYGHLPRSPQPHRDHPRWNALCAIGPPPQWG
jgi:hypothetical protein